MRTMLIGAIAAVAIAAAPPVHAQSTTPAPAPQANPANPTSSTRFPPPDVINFYIQHTSLLSTFGDAQRSDGITPVSGVRWSPDAVKAALNENVAQVDGGRPISDAARQWIQDNQIARGTVAAVTDVAGRLGAATSSEPAFVHFMTSLAVVGQQSALKGQLETNNALLRDFGRTDTDLYRENETLIQKVQADIDFARAQAIKYVRAAAEARAASGGGSSDGSGSGNTIVDGENTDIDAIDTSTAEAVRDGYAIARAFVDPTGILNGANQTLSSTQVNAMVDRIRIAQTATSATSNAAPAATDNFTDTSSDSPLTVAALNPIYKNYKVTVGPNGALVVTVPTLQVQTPTGVMTIPSNQVVVPSTQLNVTSTQINVPSTQVNVPSTQVNTPSTQVNVPSLQMTVPSTQVRTPGSAMNSLDLQPALCGR